MKGSLEQEVVFPNNLPKHIVVIMDGNGRWAAKRFLPRVAGHYRGIRSVRTLVKSCIECKIGVLTIFAFSSENWSRPDSEVKALMSLLKTTLRDELSKLNKNKVRLNIIGDIDSLSADLRRSISQAEKDTKDNIGLQLNIAFNYGGRWDIVRAAKRMCKDVGNENIALDNITEDVFQSYLSLADFPDPDLLIRTSGEQRISNFLLWHLAYAELYFTPVLWPDFSREDFQAALSFFADRKRRFGNICVAEDRPLTETTNVQ